MFRNTERSCCYNCEHLRIDNFCMIRGKYILSKNIYKYRECKNFTLIVDELPTPTNKCSSTELVLKILEEERDL